MVVEAPERLDQVGLKHADDLQRPAVGHCRNTEPLSLEGDLDVLSLGGIQPFEAKELLAVFLTLEPRDELGHDFIGTGVVDNPHPREVEGHERARPEASKALFDHLAHRVARRPGHQVIGAAVFLAHLPQVDLNSDQRIQDNSISTKSLNWRHIDVLNDFN